MPVKFLVDGMELICVDDSKFEDIKEKFRNDVTVDDNKNWECQDEMEIYTPSDCIKKARYYSSLCPPDLMQSAEKIFFGAVYAVKKLYLSCKGIHPTSHNSLKFLLQFAIDQSEKSFSEKYDLYDSWTKAEMMHRYVYGAENYRPSEFPGIISEVEVLVQALEQFDVVKLWNKFEEVFIKDSHPKVETKIEDYYIYLGGVEYTCHYSVFVK